jgi:hypothetical protein
MPGVNPTRSVRLDLQRGDEGLLPDVDLAELAHLASALLLLLQELALPCDVAASTRIEAVFRRS